MTPIGDLSVFTSAAVAWLYPQDPSLCTSFTAVCPRCQHSVLPATSLPAATPGCDVQLEHRILLLWCYRDHYLQGLAWRLWRIGRSWRRLLVVVLAANRLGLAWLESNARRYAPGGPGQVQAGIQFATTSSQLASRGEVAQLDTAVQRETQASVVSVFMFVYASPLSPLVSASVAVALRPTATPSSTPAAVPRQCICGAHGGRCVNWTDPLGVGQRRFLCDQCLQPCGCLCGGCDAHDYTTDANSDAALCMDELSSSQGPSVFNAVDLFGDLYQTRFYVHDKSGALRPSRTQVDTVWTPSPPASPPSSDFVLGIRHCCVCPTLMELAPLGEGCLVSSCEVPDYRLVWPCSSTRGRECSEVRVAEQRSAAPHTGCQHVRSETEGDPCVHDWVDICRYAPPRCLAAWCTMPGCGALMECSCRILRPKRASVARIAERPVSLSDSPPRRCVCCGYDGTRCIHWSQPVGTGPYRSGMHCANCSPILVAGRCGCLCGACDTHDYNTDSNRAGQAAALLGTTTTEQIPSPPPSPPIAGFTSVVHHAPASPEAQLALHRHLSDGVPLLVSPPCAWSQRFLGGLSAKWVAFLENWDATNGTKVVPSGFPEDPYNGFGLRWLAYWRKHTSWFVAAVKESDVNMVEQWVATCDSRQAAAVGEVISALGELLLPERHDPARSLQPFFAHALSPPTTADLHFDTYDNILWVILGRKRVWLLHRDSLPRCADQATGRWNERLDIHPTSHPSLPWVYGELRSGAMLFIPCGFWHYVLSDANTLATNQWFYPREVDHLLPPVVADGLQTLEALGTRRRRQTQWFSPSSSSS